MKRSFSTAAVYWAVVLVLAACSAGYVLVTADQVTCLDGHCPDEGTKEFLGMQAQNIRAAPYLAVCFGLLIVGGGGVFASVSTALRQMLARRRERGQRYP